MSKATQIITAGVIISLTLTGCTPSYNINPQYDSTSQKLSIGGYVFTDVKETNNRNLGTGMQGDGFYQINDFKLSSTDCSKIHYEDSKAGSKTYFTDSKYDWILESFRGGSCNVTEIANLKFLTCDNTIANGEFTDGRHYITTETTNQWGYVYIAKYSLDKNCYQNLLTHFKSLANKDNVTIKNYVAKSDIPKNVKVYYGQAKLLVDKSENNCPTSSKVKLFVDEKTNKVTGSASYFSPSGKYITTSLNGTKDKLHSRYNTFKITEYSNEVIKGTSIDGTCFFDFELTAN